jgi:hypothetical protein
MSICIVYLASPREFTYGAYRRIDMLRHSISIVKRTLPTLDILVFHENYTEEDLSQFPSTIQFVKIDFKGHEDKQLYARHRYGYLMMCRFFCGILQSHSALQPYTHYMRLDDDSFFLHPLLTEAHVSSFLKYDYVYRSVFHEEGHCQQPLHDFTYQFLAKKQWKAKHVNVGYAPYNNFHVSSLALWRQPLVKEYLHEMERMNGWLGHGFLDANVHAMIIWCLGPCFSIQLKGDFTFGYRHNHHVSRPNIDSFYFNSRISFMPTTDAIEDTKECIGGP